MKGLTEEAVAARSQRIHRVRQRMDELGVDALLLSHGADLPWLTGYQAMPLERLTMLALPVTGDPVLVVPRSGGAWVATADTLFSLLPWSDSEDPVERVVSLLTASGRNPVFPLSGHFRPGLGYDPFVSPALAAGGTVAGSVGGDCAHPRRQGQGEQEVLRAAGAAADRVAAFLQSGISRW